MMMKHFAYLCTTTTETRGTRPSVKTHAPCERWSVLRTHRNVTDDSNHQARCLCGNRPRLNGKNTRPFNSYEEAQQWCSNKNAEVVQ